MKKICKTLKKLLPIVIARHTKYFFIIKKKTQKNVKGILFINIFF